MKTALAFALAASLASAAAAETLPTSGTWSINNWVPGESVQMSMTRSKGGSRWKHTTSYDLEDLKGLTREQLRAMRGEVAFRLERDPGTFVFEGTTTMGVGSGTFRFEPSPTFRAKLVELGYGSVDIDDAGLIGMAIRDVSLEYAAEVKRLGLAQVAVEDLLAFRDRGIALEHIRQVAGAGFPQLTSRDVIRLADHGVDGRYAQGIRSSGLVDAGVEDVVRFHDRGISTEFVRKLVEGRKAITTDEIIRLHDHGVTAGYVAQVDASGFKELSVEQIVRLHDNGVD
jgi:hypothetical protein